MWPGPIARTRAHRGQCDKQSPERCLASCPGRWGGRGARALGGEGLASEEQGGCRAAMAGEAGAGRSSPFREKEELPWTPGRGRSSGPCTVEEYSQTRDV